MQINSNYYHYIISYSYDIWRSHSPQKIQDHKKGTAEKLDFHHSFMDILGMFFDCVYHVIDVVYIHIYISTYIYIYGIPFLLIKFTMSPWRRKRVRMEKPLKEIPLATWCVFRGDGHCPGEETRFFWWGKKFPKNGETL